MRISDLRRAAVLKGFAGLCALLVLPFLSVPVAAQEFMQAKDPAVFIDQLGKDAIQSLTQQDLNPTERRSRFRELLDKSVNVPGIGRFVLGRYWNVATEEERKEYLTLFEQLIVQTYADRFSQYSGEKFNVGKVMTDPNNNKYATVATTVLRPNNQVVRVDWRVRQEADGSWRVVDVVIEGVSMSLTQRSEFASVIQSKGGTVKGLLDTLRGKVQGA